VRLWVCAQELATHAVLSVPHVRSALRELVTSYVAGFRPNPRALEDALGSVDLSDPSKLGDLQQVFADPTVMLGAMQTDEQRAILPRLEALVALVVGFVDHAMDGIGAKLLGGEQTRMVEALRRRRVEADEADAFVTGLLGLSLGREQVARGRGFVGGVIERAGVEGLARLWEHDRHLPTPSELDAPGLWLARIDLPDV
jgi:putative hydrolase